MNVLVTRIVTADMRDPQAILDNPLTLQMIDFRSRQRSCSSASGSARLVLSIPHLTSEDMFEGYELVEPGLVLVHGWRPDAGSPRAPSVFGGVGRINNG